MVLLKIMSESISTVQILFDNYNRNFPELRSLWGFSAYFKEYGLLFDTGSNGRALLENMQAFSVDVQEIKYLFISHSQWDHIGGLDSILELNPNITLFVPRSLSKHLIADLKTLAKEVVVISKPQKLFANCYSTGILGDDMPEQSLIIDGEKPVVVTGCGHFGVENITKAATSYLGKNIDMCVGGFHLMRSTKKEIEDTIYSLKEMGVTRVCPTHCSGNEAIQMFEEAFAKTYIEGGLGISL